MVVLFIAFMAFFVLILGSVFADSLNYPDPFDSPDLSDLDNRELCLDACPDRSGPDGACSVCGWITEPVGSDFAPTGSTPTGTISSGGL